MLENALKYTVGLDEAAERMRANGDAGSEQAVEMKK